MWSKQQVAAVISFIVTNCFIQISCNIISNTSSVELIDNIVVDDINNNHDKSEKYIEALEVPSLLLKSVDVGDDFECYCKPIDENCFYKCLNEETRSNGIGNMFLLTAGEILLGTAIIMGLSALVTLLLRACTRRRMPRNGQDIPDLLDAFERNNNRGSLTSLQQSVISKLHDRPPRYETRHNYEHRRRDENVNQTHQAASIHNVAVLNPNANRNSEPPPPYEPIEDANTVHELPPAYTINLSTNDENTNRGGENRTACVGGITNQSFACDDNQEQQDSQQQLHGQQSGRRRIDNLENTTINGNNIRRNSVPSRTCESILYI